MDLDATCMMQQRSKHKNAIAIAAAKNLRSSGALWAFLPADLQSCKGFLLEERNP